MVPPGLLAVDAMYRGMISGMVFGIVAILLLWGICEIVDRIAHGRPSHRRPSETDLRHMH